MEPRGFCTHSRVLNTFQEWSNAALPRPVVLRMVSDLSPADQRRFDHLATSENINSILADSDELVHQIQFMRALLTRDEAVRLGLSFGVDALEVLRIYASQVDASAVPFFAGWDDLKLLLICNTVVPDSWVNAIKRMKIGKVVVIGDCGPLRPSAFAGADQIDKIVFVGSKMTLKQKSALYKMIPESQIEFQYEVPEHFFPRFDPAAIVEKLGYGGHDRQLYGLFKEEFEEIKSLLEEQGIAPNQVYRMPASAHAITLFEHRSGVVLVPPLRAMVELTNGQQEKLPGSDERWLSLDEMFRVSKQLDFQIDHSVRDLDDFRALSNQLRQFDELGCHLRKRRRAGWSSIFEMRKSAICSRATKPPKSLPTTSSLT